jgi:hypothetical protein
MNPSSLAKGAPALDLDGQDLHNRQAMANSSCKEQKTFEANVLPRSYDIEVRVRPRACGLKVTRTAVNSSLITRRRRAREH